MVDGPTTEERDRVASDALGEGSRRVGLQVWAFALFFLLLNWPILSVAHDAGPTASFVYLFAVWGAAIVVAAALRGGAAPPGAPSGGDASD